MRKKGNIQFWTRRTHLLRRDEYICSACGISARKAFKVCPNCGANMGKTKYEPTWVDEAEILDIIDE